MRRKWNWNDLPLRGKISVSFIALYTVLLVAITLLVNLIYRNLMDTRVREQAQYEERLMVQQVEKFIGNVTSCNNNVILSLNMGFRQFPDAPEFPGQSMYQVDRMFLSSMINSMFMFNEASRISVVLGTGVLYTQDRTNMRNSIRENLPLYQFFSEHQVDTEGSWFYGLEDVFGSEAGQISFVKSLRDTQTNSGVGYVVVCIDAASIQELYRNPHSTSDTYYGVFSSGGIHLTPAEEESAREGAALRAVAGWNGCTVDETLQLFERQYYLSETVLGKQEEWVLVSVIDRDMAMQGANVITAGVLAVGLLLMIAANIIIAMIARRISNPIQSMAEHMVRFDQTLPDQLPAYRSQDEIGVLTDNFNRMIRKNRELFDHVVEEQRQKRHYELALLQTQIKPHFLYNTLDAAYCLAGDGRAEDAKRLLKLLADYYRVVLNKGDEWISVAKELEAVEKYMEIQKIRYDGLFEFEIDVTPDILRMQIPKLTLQPLVENAVYHGLKPKGEGGTIRITGEMLEDWAVLRIWDNGLGFPREKFKSLLNGGGAAAGPDSFGIKNISNRLRLFYGPKSHLELESVTGQGTMLAIHIFLGMEEEDDV